MTLFALVLYTVASHPIINNSCHNLINLQRKKTALVKGGDRVNCTLTKSFRMYLEALGLSGTPLGVMNPLMAGWVQDK